MPAQRFVHIPARMHILSNHLARLAGWQGACGATCARCSELAPVVAGVDWGGLEGYSLRTALRWPTESDPAGWAGGEEADLSVPNFEVGTVATGRARFMAHYKAICCIEDAELDQNLKYEVVSVRTPSLVAGRSSPN